MIENIGSIITNTGEEMLKMWRVTVPQGKRTIYKHSHINFELAVVLSGKAIYLTETGEYEISKGDVIVFSSNETHCIKEVFEGRLTLLNMHFVPRYLRNASHDDFTEKNINFCFAHGKNFKSVIKSETGAELSSLIYKIEEELMMKKSEYKVMVKSIINQITVMLIRNFNYGEELAQNNIKNLHGIRKAMNYIDDNFTSELSLEVLSDIAGLTPNYFSSLFKKVNNISLWSYINSKRIDLAIEFIIDSSNTDTILEIATKCGFNNTANFNKTFRNVTGMTPTEYRTSGQAIYNI